MHLKCSVPASSGQENNSSAPSASDFVAFHITRDALPRWLQLSEVARKVHAILASLPGVFRDGWRGSRRKLRELYREMAGSWLNGHRLQAVLDELVAAGFLDIRQMRRAMAVTVRAPGRESTRPGPGIASTRTGYREYPASTIPAEVPDSEVTATTSSIESSSNPPPPRPSPAADECIRQQTERGTSDRAADDLVDRVRSRFDGQIGAATVRRLVDETSEENVTNQLDWFDFRDSSWARRGPVAAFVVYCRDRAGEPETLITQRRREAQQAQEILDQAARKKRNQIIREEVQQALETLSDDVIEACRDAARQALGIFYRGPESPSFRAAFQREVLAASEA